MIARRLSPGGRPIARAAAAVVTALAGVAGPASAQTHGHGASSGRVVPATLAYNAVLPENLDIVTGDTVRWTNESVRAHTITADDGSFDSGSTGVGEHFDRGFHAAGTVAYHCTLHPFLRGTVGVHPLLLSVPRQAAAPGRPYPLAGRAALPPRTPVTIEADHGGGYAPVARAQLEADGTFVTSIVPRATATYRAVAEGFASPPVTLVVLDRTIAIELQRGKRRSLLRTRVAPAAPGAPVVLQLYLRERFGWWPVQRGRLDLRSRARFALRTRRRVAARVVLTLPDGATPLAVSRTVRVGAGALGASAGAG